MEFHGPRTQILDEGTATNATVIIYTVPANKIFWLMEALLTVDGGAAGQARIEIRNATDVHVRDVCRIEVVTAVGVAPSDHFQPQYAIEIPAGYDITIISGAASLVAEGVDV